jgi:hypothetical protein
MKGHATLGRIQKPRSAKQRAHAQRYGHQAQPIVVIPADSGVPTASWWIGRSREEFSAALAGEASRMRQARFANVSNATYGAES